MIDSFEAQAFGPGITFLSLGRCERVDWFRVFVELQDRKRSFDRISEDTGIAPSTLKGWKGGSRPKFEEGIILIAYWVGATGKPAEELPLKNNITEKE